MEWYGLAFIRPHTSKVLWHGDRTFVANSRADRRRSRERLAKSTVRFHARADRNTAERPSVHDVIKIDHRKHVRLQNSTVSRRCVLNVGFYLLCSLFVGTCHSQARTILDEERELAESARRSELDRRISGLRVGFDSVEKSTARLDEFGDVLRQVENADDWKFVREFSRKYNNDIVRERMSRIADALLDDTDRKRAKALCGQLTDELFAISQAAKLKNRDSTLKSVQTCKTIIEEFVSLRPK